MIKNKPYFITIEGIEGVGKSSVTQIIGQYLKSRGIPCVLTREPGGTSIAEKIRQLLLTAYLEKMESDTELLLLFASRAQHIASVIKPALLQGKWVICDRFTDASYAYQGGGRGIDKARIAVLEDWVHGHFQPDLTLLLDAPVEIAMKRIQKRVKDRIEQEKFDFFERVREVYLEMAQKNPQRYRCIDASQSIEYAKEQVEKLLSQTIGELSK